MTNAPDYTPNSEILTKAQVNDLVSKLTSPDALTDASKATLATQIIDTFGQNAFGVFKQIAPKDPIFSNVGYLLVDNPNNIRNCNDNNKRSKTYRSRHKITRDSAKNKSI